MPASLASRDHLTISRLMNSENCSGLRGSTFSHRLSSFVLVSPLAMALETAVWILLMTSRGVPAGAAQPFHKITSNPGNCSAKAGRSGANGDLLSEVTAYPL